MGRSTRGHKARGNCLESGHCPNSWPPAKTTAFIFAYSLPVKRPATIPDPATAAFLGRRRARIKPIPVDRLAANASCDPATRAQNVRRGKRGIILQTQTPTSIQQLTRFTHSRNSLRNIVSDEIRIYASTVRSISIGHARPASCAKPLDERYALQPNALRASFTRQPAAAMDAKPAVPRVRAAMARRSVGERSLSTRDQ